MTGSGTGDDSVLPFELRRANIRGRFVRLDNSLNQILGQHGYPPLVGSLVSEATLLTALIGQSIKLRWRFSLQVRGDGPVKLIATDYFAPSQDGGTGQIRAYADYDAQQIADLSPKTCPFSLLGQGFFGITIEQGTHMRPYQGITPLAGGSLAACAEIYFAQSEQIATRFATLAAQVQSAGAPTKWRAGAIMIQQLPNTTATGGDGDAPSGEAGLMTPGDIAAMGGQDEDWRRVGLLLDTVEATELIGPHVSPETLLVRLFHEETPVAYEAGAIRFGCTCSQSRVEAAVMLHSPEEIEDMRNEAGLITADCQFCGQHYELDAQSLSTPASTHNRHRE